MNSSGLLNVDDSFLMYEQNLFSGLRINTCGPHSFDIMFNESTFSGRSRRHYLVDDMTTL